MTATALRRSVMMLLIGATVNARAQTQAPAQPSPASSADPRRPAPPIQQPPLGTPQAQPAYTPPAPADASQPQPPYSPPPTYAPPAYAPTAAPTIVFVRPAPPPPEPKVGVHLHDGFYLRMSFGMGRGQGTFKNTIEGIMPDEYKFTGLGALFDVMVGGSPIPGFVIGGAFVGHTIIDPRVKLNGASLDTNSSPYAFNMSTIGGFMAVYPDPKLGFNIHGLAGIGTLSVKVGEATVTPEPIGVSLMAGAGYDFWIADQWSMGPDFRLAYCKGTAKDSHITNDASILMPTISFTATLH